MLARKSTTNEELLAVQMEEYEQHAVLCHDMPQ